MRETESSNHNQMGKLSNSGKSLVQERKSSIEGRGGANGLFCSGLYVILKMPERI